MNNLKKNCTYLIKFGVGETMSSITILMVTEKAYLIRWNIGIKTSDTWELKSILDRNYRMIEDITEQINTEIFDKIKFNPLDATYEVQKSKELCPICHGIGTIPDSNNTAGKISCPLCNGNKLITTKILEQI